MATAVCLPVRLPVRLPVCLSLSFRHRRKRSLPCCISPLPPSLPSHPLPLVLSPDRCIKSSHPSPAYNQLQRQKAKHAESPELRPGSKLIKLHSLVVTLEVIKHINFCLQRPVNNSQPYIYAVVDCRPPKFPPIIAYLLLFPSTPICYLTYTYSYIYNTRFPCYM